ncbi:DUF2796 domain-containing protein [Saccharospirillum salsuginis]|uniref:DUF2796 domain-containing protein n=1 Tax=Saccharospirillum salsuginis TaxID=418750 RepID=A0A918N881_9GAMM|nr:DUF2796 domain-containing protein [Saccharospirillum salsuginis]GGX47197.1 hypothetical protein GCM10007392_12520 [Saccharospirillum salsuginis]
MKTSLLAIAVAGVAVSAQAETQRQHDAHEHGAASLLVSAEGSELVITLDSPAYNLFGFEHAPSTDAQKVAVEEGLARLNAGAELLTVNRSAACELEDSHVETALASDEGHEDEYHGGDEHGHEEQHHDDHDHDDEHHDEDEHGHEEDHHDEREAETKGGHSDVVVEWHFHCDNPADLTGIDVGLFDVFPNLMDLDAQYLLDNAQGAQELSPANPSLRF